MMITDEKLIEIAREARKKAYAPYSDFCVGAALLCSDGRIYDGCNIENASFTPTCCAERVAVYKAVSDKNTDFCTIAIVGGKRDGSEQPCYPCGVCRQVLSEFADAKLRILVFDGNDIISTTLGELLPKAFEF